MDFGVSQAYVCLAFELSVSVRQLAACSTMEAFALYKYLARAWHMLLVDWLLRTLAHSTGGLQRGLQIREYPSDGSMAEGSFLFL